LKKIPEKLKFNFVAKETKKALAGKVTYDNSSYGYTTGFP
jgi:hypothetical protein